MKVKGIYTDIPETVIINVEKLQIGQSIKIADLKFDNFELANAKELVVAGVRTTRAAAAAAATEEEAAE